MSCCDRGTTAIFDKKLISMVVLTALIVIPVCSILDKNIPINFEKEFTRFLNIWFFLGLSALFWNIFLCADPPLVGLLLIVKTAWCMGLLSSFLIFLNNIEYMMEVAIDHWGTWGGPSLVLAFSFTWIYTVFNFYNQPRECNSSSDQVL
ncbi:unnamed protein product [Allacma fusca]|uniref:Uncharacterized protein n=1 Tax=Allacma fusca TaxID=39272 RepID=A0A8J2LQK9_9HEXA|nr:unnamed protein product [Allacma fusca]